MAKDTEGRPKAEPALETKAVAEAKKAKRKTLRNIFKIMMVATLATITEER